MRFRCIPIAPQTADRFRRTGVDDGGNPIQRRTVDAPGAPCRQCLRDAEIGEDMLLLSWHLPRPLGIYWTPSPIFLHAQSCAPFAVADTVAPIVRNRLVSVRAYDRDGMCLYELGDVEEGAVVDGLLTRALADRRTDFVNIHTARPGCLRCQVERLE
ncbi:MAG: DUF1203 domain-containing protein [Rhodospirillales bacterium]